jgi:hypothetical protein
MIYLLYEQFKCVTILDPDGHQVYELELDMSPSGMALDTAGNLYISSAIQHEIRKYTRVGDPFAAHGVKPTNAAPTSRS